MKTTLFLLIFIAVPQLAFPQTIFPKVGLSFAKFATSDVEPANEFSEEPGDINFRAGYLLGFGFIIPLNKRISLQPELMYIQKGTRTDYVYDYLYLDDTGIRKSEIHENIVINYLESVLLFRYNITLAESNVPIYAAAGVSAGIGLGGKRKHFTRSEYDDSDAWEYRREDDVRFSGEPWELRPNQIRIENSTDLGLSVGAGVVLWKKMMIDLRYTHGFNSLFNPSSYDLNGTHYQYENRVRNQGIQLSVALPLLLKKA
jgi:hypothetical protein